MINIDYLGKYLLSEVEICIAYFLYVSTVHYIKCECFYTFKNNSKIRKISTIEKYERIRESIQIVSIIQHFPSIFTRKFVL